MQVFPTKGNLLALKKKLSLAQLGYELLDRKRNIMLREMLNMAKNAADLQLELNISFKEAYDKLRDANITVGQTRLIEAANSVKFKTDDITVRSRNVMGVDIAEVVPIDFNAELSYGFNNTDFHVDLVYIAFNKVKMLMIRQTVIENNVFRLAYAIKQSQKRANALKNIVIPTLKEQIKYITSYLEEKERDEFALQKLIKGT
jgi:V/A-type H+-transporting ATPase subunit D